jgi:hypothetical protein
MAECFLESYVEKRNRQKVTPVALSRSEVDVEETGIGTQPTERG